MIRRHEPGPTYYRGAKDAFEEMQRFLNKLLEKVAVYEAESINDMVSALEANLAAEEAKNGPDNSPVQGG